MLAPVPVTMTMPVPRFVRTFSLLFAAALSTGLSSGVAHAQSALTPSLSVEMESDRRERGLSWSDGQAALSAEVDIPVTYDLNLSVDASTLRGSPRHGGADLGVSLSPQYTFHASGWDVTLGGRGHLFVGESGLHYGEVTGDIAHTLGPAQLVVGAAYAPSQKAIGGSNLYLDAQLSLSVPGTPFTVYGGVGHSSGSTRNSDAGHGYRVTRLRPGGDYLDHHIGAEYSRGMWTAGLRYSGTSIGRDEVNWASRYADRDYGSRVVAYLRLTPSL